MNAGAFILHVVQISDFLLSSSRKLNSTTITHKMDVAALGLERLQSHRGSCMHQLFPLSLLLVRSEEWYLTCTAKWLWRSRFWRCRRVFQDSPLQKDSKESPFSQ